MNNPIQPKVLMDEDGIRITTRQVSTDAGDFPFRDIQAVDRQVVKPVWGPLFLALLGTLNLAIALQSLFWVDLLASAIMLGGGLFWWLRGTRHTLILTMPTGPVSAWFTRSAARLQQALEIIGAQLDKRRAGEQS